MYIYSNSQSQKQTKNVRPLPEQCKKDDNFVRTSWLEKRCVGGLGDDYRGESSFPTPLLPSRYLPRWNVGNAVRSTPPPCGVDLLADPTHLLQARPFAFFRICARLHPLNIVLDRQRKLILLFGRAHQQDNFEVLCTTELSGRVSNVPASYSGESGSTLVPETGYYRVSSGFL